MEEAPVLVEELRQAVGHDPPPLLRERVDEPPHVVGFS
jgi:hypothetical protein